MDGRDTSPLGIPKSPSFHSGLDMVASASVGSFVDLQVSGKDGSAFEGTKDGGVCLQNFTLTLRRDKQKSPNGGGKSDGDSCLEEAALQKGNGVERIVQMQGRLPRLAGI